jgi:hypothetical protein
VRLHKLCLVSAARVSSFCCSCSIQPDRTVLGDIVLFFAAAAVAEPTARLVMWQASKQDKTWLSG